MHQDGFARPAATIGSSAVDFGLHLMTQAPSVCSVTGRDGDVTGAPYSTPFDGPGVTQRR
ncbi:hypothetical protein MARA_08050 [Mycolicibacterium arabiense]|uniref:Uncharacterized protein n=1 Tax=Mycolicibacterium arabiense TaxID=1286181 RepID=A0A7I7RS39_9MYCO|nr:hypothetical protein MARA_08050 [Mycolicibacterium arabiense]